MDKSEYLQRLHGRPFSLRLKHTFGEWRRALEDAFFGLVAIGAMLLFVLAIPLRLVIVPIYEIVGPSVVTLDGSEITWPLWFRPIHTLSELFNG